MNIHNNEIFHVYFAIFQKLLRKSVKTCNKSKKPRNTAAATYFAK